MGTNTPNQKNVYFNIIYVNRNAISKYYRVATLFTSSIQESTESIVTVTTTVVPDGTLPSMVPNVLIPDPSTWWFSTGTERTVSTGPDKRKDIVTTCPVEMLP